MDKLYRYKGKDYSMCIDFPVEIIGKDGVVRHYSFEESIHLYQRRIRSARMRYEQIDIVDAEIDHCSKRIAQLRRSYYARFGWESFLFSGDVPHGLSSEFAGEMAAYLRRKFGCGVHQDKAKVTCLQQSDGHYIFMVENVGAPHLLLHLFTTQDQYKSYHQLLSSSKEDQYNVEYILDTIDEEDFWLIVSGTEKNQHLPMAWSAQRIESIFLQDAIQAIHEGDLLEAMAHFMLALDENPYLRGAYWGSSILAEQMRVHGESELVLRMGTTYFPKDAGLWLRFAATLLRRNAKETKETLRRAEHLNAQLNTDFLWAIYHFVNNNNRLGNRYLQKVKRNSTFPFHISLRWLDVQLSTRRLIVRTSQLLSITSLLLALLLHYSFAIGGIIAIGLWASAEYKWKRNLSRALQGKSFHQLTLLPSTDIQQITKAFQRSH